jgi:hypothetical protein
MQSRLETLDPALAQEISRVSFSDAHEKVRIILIQTMASIPDEVSEILTKEFRFQLHTVSHSQVYELDERYFDLEENGEIEKSSAAFMSARLLSAVMSWQAAKSHFELCEAIYEARFAIEQTK